MCCQIRGFIWENCNGNHFETVVCVQQVHGQSCYGYCKVDTSCHSGYNLRHHGDAKDVCLDVGKLSASSSIVPNAAETADVIERHEQSTSSNSDNTVLKFKPLSLKLARTMCNKCDVELEKQDGQRPKVSGYLGAVCKTESIVKDGNSFFRAITQVISGSQKRHLMIRRVVVKHMEKDGDLIQLVGQNYTSMCDYISKSQMKYVGHSATNVEIQATANAFGVDIYSYSSESWHKFSCKNKVSEEGIYLKQCEDNHFEQVVCVQNKDQLGCFGLCKDASSEMQYMCTRKVKLETDSTSHSSVNVKHCFTKYSKIKRNLQNTRAYHLNDLCRQKVLERCSKKYNENISHRQIVKERSIAKYKKSIAHRQMLKQNSKDKYNSSMVYRQMVRERSIGKYKANIAHRVLVKARSILKYKINMDHRQNVKAMSTRKYHENVDHKVRAIASKKRKRLENKVKSEELDFVMEQFLEKVKDGPDFCVLCLQ